MEIWHLWTTALSTGIFSLAGHFGLSEAMAIILLTLIARTVLMPISLSTSYRMELNKQKLKHLKPELYQLRERCKDNPTELAARTMQFYRDNGIRFFDRLSLLNMGAQGFFGLGLFQVLGKGTFSAKFLWIANIAKPDMLITILVGLLMLACMALAPGGVSEPTMLLMIGVSVIVAVVSVASMPAAVGLYWATSNVVSILQALALHALLRRRRVRMYQA